MMAIKHNPYGWSINTTNKSANRKKSIPKDDIKQIRKDIIEELYDAVNQPYIIEEDIDLLIQKLYHIQGFRIEIKK